MAVSDYGYCWQLWIRPTELFFFFSPLELDLISVLGRQNLGLHAVYALLSEKTMAPHFSTLAWKIPWMEEPGGLQFMGSLRVRHGWETSLSLFTCMHWRRKWQPTPVFLPGESQGRGSLVGCRPWGRTESDATAATQQQQQQRHCCCQSLSYVLLFAAPWTAAHQASQSFTISWNLLKHMSIKLVMPSNHLILCHPLLLSNYLCAKQPIWLYVMKYLFDVFTHVTEVLIFLILRKSTLSSFSLWLYFLCPKKCLPT